MDATVYHFGRFRLDLRSHHLFRDDDIVALSARAWDALVVLVVNRARVVGKDELIAAVWPDRAVSEDLLPQTILALRRALGDDSAQPTFIATIPRRGYRFIAPVTESHGDAPVTPRPQQPVPHAGTSTEMQPGTPAPAGVARAVPPRADVAVPVPGRDRGQAPAWGHLARAALALSIVALAAAGWFFSRSTPRGSDPEGRPLRFTQRAPEGAVLVSGGALSPDGRHLAFITEDSQTGRTQLWVRTFDAEEPQPLAGTEGARKPFWSADSRVIGFFANEKLKVVGATDSATTATPQTVASVGLSPGGAAWAPGGDILFARWKEGLSLVSGFGGPPTIVTTLDPAAQEIGHQTPQFLPDGRHFLYFVNSATPARSGTYVGSLDDATDKRRIADAHAVYADPGYLVFVRDGALLAQPFDVSSMQLTGAARTLAGDVGQNTPVSAASGDLLAFGGGTRGGRLAWFDRAGQVVGTLDTPTRLHNPAFTPNLKQLMASSSGEVDQRGVWLVDLDRGAPTRFVPHGTSPLSSPDGARIVFTSDRAAGIADVYVRSASGQDEENMLLKTPENKILNDWTADGRFIVYVSTNPLTKKDIWLLPGDGDRTPRPFLQTPFNEIQAKVSPDGRWLAYASDESGAWEVYIQSFPDAGMKQIISVGGGAQPNWRRDGHELFYLSADHRIMSVDITSGETLRVGQPRALFRAPVEGSLNSYRSHYAATADGQRFLVDTTEPEPHRDAISVLVNWRALLQ